MNEIAWAVAAKRAARPGGGGGGNVGDGESGWWFYIRGEVTSCYLMKQNQPNQLKQEGGWVGGGGGGASMEALSKSHPFCSGVVIAHHPFPR